VLTAAQVKALLAPLISFDVKTPIQAYTDTLPTPLKNAILDHKVLVGMNTEMVMFAKGQPNSKSREMDEQMPFEEWIYGTPPEEVDFVRINGNRVIRVEIARAAAGDLHQGRGFAHADGRRNAGAGLPAEHAHHQRRRRRYRSEHPSGRSAAEPAQPGREAAHQQRQHG
jgi:hypothetical protein